MGLRTIAVHSEADAGLPFVREADEAVLLGPAPPGGVLPRHRQAARGRAAEPAPRRSIRATASWPRARSSPQAVIDAGLVWVGPPPAAIAAMGDKISARNLMADAGVPVAPGTHEPVADVEAALAAAREIGYPLMVKAAAGGGGIGMGVAHDDDGCERRSRPRGRRAERFFGSPSILLERYIEGARHVEVQVLGLADGRVVALGDRDCSVQRRHQKVPRRRRRPVWPTSCARRMLAGAVLAGEAVGYRNAGTVECLVDPVTQDVCLSGDEHPAAGRAPDHRAGHRHRPRRGAAADRRGRPAGRRPRPTSVHAAMPSSYGCTPRIRSASCRPRATITVWDEPTGTACGSTPATPRARRSRRTTTRCSPSSASGRLTRPSAIERGTPGGRRVPDRGHQDEPAVLHRAARRRRRSSRVTTTPDSSRG